MPRLESRVCAIILLEQVLNVLEEGWQSGFLEFELSVVDSMQLKAKADNLLLLFFFNQINNWFLKKKRINMFFAFLAQVLIDNEEVEGGDLETDWDFLPPKKVKDPNQSKPDDWDDKPTIPDPDDKKPDDWDKPEHIPDPEATKPEDWDDEMDGEWEAPMIDNPDYKVHITFSFANIPS